MARSKRITVVGCVLVLSLALGTASAEVVVIVSAQSPVSALTRAQLADIYLGRSNRLPNGDPVVPIDQAFGSAAHDLFYRDYIGRSTALIKAHWSRLIFTGRGQPPKAVPNDSATAEIVAENPNTIGYVDSGHVDIRLRIVPIE